MSVTKKKPAKKKPTSRNPQQSSWLEDATLQTLLRYGPQQSVLRQATDAAQDNYRSALDAARTYATITGNAAQAAVEPTKAWYAQARDREAGIAKTVNDSLAGLSGPGVDLMKAAAVSEQGNFAGIANQEGTNAVQRLTDMQLQAKSGEQAARVSAHGQLVNELTKIIQQTQDLASESGTFKALTYNQLREEAEKAASASAQNDADNAASRGNAYISAGMTPDGAGLLPSKAAKAKPGTRSATGAVLLSPDKHNEKRELWASALSDLKADPPPKVWPAGTPKAGKRLTDRDIMQDLVKGREAVKDASGKVIHAAIPPIKDPLMVAAAVEQFRHGRISKKTQRALADAGFSIKRLGLTTDREFQKRKAAKRKKAPHKVADAVAQVGRMFG